MIGLNLIQETDEKVKMIRERLKVATDKQKSYTDLKRKDIQYEIGEKVFLKVYPWKKIMRFGRKGKLSLRFCNVCCTTSTFTFTIYSNINTNTNTFLIP